MNSMFLSKLLPKHITGHWGLALSLLGHRSFNKKVSNAVYVPCLSHPRVIREIYRSNRNEIGHATIIQHVFHVSLTWPWTVYVIVNHYSQVLMRGMNHSLHLLTGNSLEHFMIKNPLPQLGTAGVEQGPAISPLADRPLLTMAPHTYLINLDQCHQCHFYLFVGVKVGYWCAVACTSTESELFIQMYADVILISCTWHTYITYMYIAQSWI